MFDLKSNKILFVIIMIIVLYIIFYLYSYNVTMSRLSGYWKADDTFLAESELDHFSLLFENNNIIITCEQDSNSIIDISTPFKLSNKRQSDLYPDSTTYDIKYRENLEDMDSSQTFIDNQYNMSVTIHNKYEKLMIHNGDIVYGMFYKDNIISELFEKNES